MTRTLTIQPPMIWLIALKDNRAGMGAGCGNSWVVCRLCLTVSETRHRRKSQSHSGSLRRYRDEQQVWKFRQR